MTETETSKILAVIASVYPQYQKNRDPVVSNTLWYSLFEEESYQEVNAALKAFIASDEKGFPPVPGQLKAIIANAKLPDSETTETEAWAMVARATRNSIYNSAEEYAKLPEEIQRVVGSPAMLREWALMDTDTFNSVVSSNFMRSYRARVNHVRETMKLPPAVKEVLGALGGSFRMPDALEGKNPAALPGTNDTMKGWELTNG